MKHQHKNISRRLAAAMMAGAMMVSMVGMTAFAATDQGDISFEKKLTISGTTYAPNVTFDYSIAAGTPVNATANTPEIKAGVGVDDISIGDAAFTSTTPVINGSTSVNVAVDFSNVTFSEPGIYRYIITETPADDTANPDIVDDTNATRYMDVYVVNPDEGDSNYKIDHVVLLQEAATISQSEDGTYKYVDSDGAEITGKNTGYTASYTTYDLELKKVITGDMATMGDEFDFTINLSGGDSGEMFSYNDKVYTFDENGEVSITGIRLGNNETVIITGIPSDIDYEIVENISRTEGYTTTATVKKGNDGTETSAVVTASDNAQTVATQDKSQQTDYVVVTNTKDAVSPTGIAMTIAPYAIMVVAAAGVAFLFLRRRHNEF